MILIYEFVQRGMSHGPFTRAFVHLVAHAFPATPLTIFAQQSHLDSVLKKDNKILAHDLVKQAYVPPSVTERGFWGHFFSALSFLKKTYPPSSGAIDQVVFLSTEPHLIWAAKLFRKFRPGFRCHFVLHGDINSLRYPRGRNPYHRALDYFTALSVANHPDIRYIALESHIRTNLIKLVPASAAMVDVVRHPCMPDDTDWQGFSPLPCRMRFGLLGIAGRSKGLDVFSRMALAATRTLPTQPDFRLIGKIQAGNEGLDLGGISGPLPFTHEFLPRAVFEEEVASLHFVILPYNMDYYGLSASGVLQDVLRWRKPVIAFDTPVIRELIAQFGDIGHICSSEAEMADAVNGLLANFDQARYARQRQNVDAAYQSRLPDAAAAEFVDAVAHAWPHPAKAV